MMDILGSIYDTLVSGYFYFFLMLTLLVFFVFMLYKKFDKMLNLITLHPQIANKVEITPVNKYKQLDNKCYTVLYNVYNMIGSAINVERSEIFDEKYLLKLNEAKKIFYGVKRNKDLIKSNFLLLKILKKIKTYEIKKNEIDDTIIYLIILVLNKKK
jgi:hypothetical protein